MPTKYPVDTVLSNSERIARVWADNPTFALGEVTLKNLQDRIASVHDKRERLEALKMQATALSNDLGGEVAGLAGINTRALSGLRAVYGPNSTQYQQGGGTRADERKRTPRKKNVGSKPS